MVITKIIGLGMKHISLLLLLLTVLLFSEKLNAQNIDITFPTNRAIFQRSNSNSAVVYFSGNYRIRLDQIQVRLVPINGGTDTGWQTIVQNPRNGIYKGAVVANGGWYQATIRGLQNGEVKAEFTLDRIGVGEVFLISGQSNAQGYYGKGQKAASDDRVNVINSLYDPANSKPSYPTFGHLNAESAIAPNGQGAWCWGQLGDLLAQRLNVPVLFMNSASEGMPIGEFIKSAEGFQGTNPYSGNKAPAGYPYSSLTDVIHYWIHMTGIRAVLWHQGESDNFLNTPSDVYSSQLKRIIELSRFNTGKNLSWMVARASKDPDGDDSKIINAQNNVINSTYNVFEGPNTDVIKDRTDNVHFSTVGMTTAAQLWSEKINSTFFAQSTPQLGNAPLTLQPYCGYLGTDAPMELIGPDGYNSYQWSNGNTNPRLRVNQGNFQLTAKDGNGNITYSPVINYDDRLLGDVPNISAAGSTSFCAGESVQLNTNTSTLNYWNNGAEGLSISPSTAGYYFVTHINTYGCPLSSNTIEVKLYPTPTPTIIASGPLDFCDNKSLSLSADLKNDIQWSTGETANEINITESGIYKVSARNEFGCIGNSEEVKVNILPSPKKPSLNLIGENIICADQETIISTDLATNMIWSDSTIASQLKVNKEGNYFATSINEFNCSKNSDTLFIKVNPVPSKPLITLQGSSVLCEYEPVRLVASDAKTYFWNNGSETKEIEVTNTPNMYLKVANEFGCVSQSSDTLKLTILNSPAKPTIIKYGTYHLKTLLENEGGNLEYHWQFNNEDLITSQPEIKVFRTGIYSIYVKEQYLTGGNVKSCVSENSDYFYYTLVDFNNGFSLYPNPMVGDQLTIESLKDMERAQVSIYNLNGNLIDKRNIDFFSKPEVLNLNNLTPGMYIIKVRNNYIQHSAKFKKE